MLWLWLRMNFSSSSSAEDYYTRIDGMRERVTGSFLALSVDDDDASDDLKLIHEDPSRPAREEQ